MDSMSPSAKPKRKILGVVVVLGLLALVVIIDVKRRTAEAQLAKLSMRLEELGGNSAESQALADGVIEQLKKHVKLNSEIKPTVASIVDIEKLEEQNPEFYADAENGDYLVIYPDKAFIFDDEEDIIVNFAPVQITQPEAAAQAPAGEAPAAQPQQ